MHPGIHLRLANERMETMRRAAEASQAAESAARAAVRAARPLDDAAHLLLRLDRVADREALARLAALSARPLPDGPFVVAEVDGRLVAALPLPGGTPLADPFVATAHLRPLLELRAEQIRRAGIRERLRRFLLPRRA